MCVLAKNNVLYALNENMKKTVRVFEGFEAWTW